MRGRGTDGLQRNILAENILEKFKEELEMLRTKEQNQLAQTCEQHGESVNLVLNHTFNFILFLLSYPICQITQQPIVEIRYLLRSVVEDYFPDKCTYQGYLHS